MSDHRTEFLKLAASDPNYSPEAYEFLCHALVYTQQKLGRVPPPNVELNPNETHSFHVSGQELMEGVRAFALEQFGRLAYIVFKTWGINESLDFGRMVYRLIDAGLWHKLPEDRIEDFADAFDFKQAFVDGFRFELDDL